MAAISAENPHLTARLVEIEARRIDPDLSAILVERIAIYNRALAYVLSASVVFTIAFYAATKV